MQELPLQIQNTKPDSVWDLYVPIIESKTTTHAYLTSGIDEPSFYNQLCHSLYCAGESDTFYLHINTPGGMLDTTFMLLDAIRNSKAHVIGHLTGTVASAGTIIALTCDDLICSDDLAWMSHYYSAHIGGKGNEIKARQDFTERTTSATFRRIHEGFFTKKEIEEMINGKDFWLDEHEVRERWARKQFTIPRLADEAEPTQLATKRGRPRKA